MLHIVFVGQVRIQKNNLLIFGLYIKSEKYIEQKLSTTWNIMKDTFKCKKVLLQDPLSATSLQTIALPETKYFLQAFCSMDPSEHNVTQLTVKWHHISQ